MDQQHALLDLIYEAAIVPERWPGVLDAVSGHLGGLGGLLFTGDGGRWTCSASVHDPFLRIVEEGWLERNSRLSRALAAGLAHRAVTDLDIFTPTEMDADPLYRALRPIGWGWFAGMAVNLPGRETAIFSFERSYAAGPYDAAAAQRLERLRPHLARATLLASRFGFDQHATRIEALAAAGLPAAVLGAGGRVLAVNSQFEEALSGTVLTGGRRLRLGDPAADSRLAAALQCIDLGHPDRARLSVPLRPRDAEPARVLHLLPIRRAARDVFTGSACIAVMTAVRGLPDPALIGPLFELSPREAALAVALVGGDTLAGYAARTGISANTARSQLKRVFEKTGVRRQAELVGLLAGLRGA